MPNNTPSYEWTQVLLLSAALYCLLVALASFLIGENNLLSDSALVALLLIALFAGGLLYLGKGKGA